MEHCGPCHEIGPRSIVKWNNSMFLMVHFSMQPTGFSVEFSPFSYTLHTAGAQGTGLRTQGCCINSLRAGTQHQSAYILSLLTRLHTGFSLFQEINIHHVGQFQSKHCGKFMHKIPLEILGQSDGNKRNESQHVWKWARKGKCSVWQHAALPGVRQECMWQEKLQK